MERQSPQDLPAQYWYGTPGVIEHWFYGVFAGGGAKGIAYSGALLAMKNKNCWFIGVAGASAGAITAALVASGLSPEEIGNATDSALRQVQTGIWAGLHRLEKTTGYFPSDGLRVWLDDLLGTQVSRKTGTMPGHNVTFRQLHGATGIELNVVAADLSLRRQIIFSHIETPNCVVADAVVASSSIPFAFPSRLLQVREGNNGRIYHHTVVDGGVWSNFPMFIFEDNAFRKRYHRDPEEVDPGRVIGFLLKEEDDQVPPRGEDVEFVEAVPPSEFRAREWAKTVKTVVDEPSGLGSKVGAWMLYPFSLLGRLVNSYSEVEPGRWPAPRSRLARNLVHSVNGLLGGIHPGFLGLLACMVVVVGAWKVISLVYFSLDFGLSWLKTLELPIYKVPAGLLMEIVPLMVFAVAVSVLLVFASLLGVAANFILLRASRRILYGLVTTYVSGTGATEWATERRNIVALPIPPSVTTLSFDMPAKERQALIASARLTTLAKLNDILGKKHDRGLLDRP
jgi:predicted acylesterase/phospholipase RssA